MIDKQNKNVFKIPFKRKMVYLYFDDFEDEVDLDQLTFVDYNNLHSEFITISSLYNRVGIWKAEAEKQYNKQQLNVKIISAEKANEYRRKLKREDSYANGKPKMVWPTKDEVDNAVILDEEVQLELEKEILYKQRASVLDSLFWSVKSKEKKIDRLVEHMKIKPEDFENEIVEGKWNGILIKTRKRAIPG